MKVEKNVVKVVEVVSGDLGISFDLLEASAVGFCRSFLLALSGRAFGSFLGL